jgi:phytoene dehydrogenase-like protein
MDTAAVDPRLDTPYDTIVIGGGHNGLVCAAYLAQAGQRVLVLESRPHTGGCASTVEAVGARVNVCNCDHMAFRTTPIADELDLASFGLKYLEVDPAQLSVPWNGSRPWYHFHDLDRTLESLRLTHPDEVEGYRRFIAAARPAAELVVEMATQVPTLCNATRRVLDRRAAGVRTLLAWSRRSVGSVLSDFFHSEALLAPVVVTGPAVWGLSPETPNTGLGALGYAMKHNGRTGRPEGGSGSLPAALHASILARGGTIRCDATVTRILADGAKVRGVVLADGTEFDSTNVVVACDPTNAFLQWLSPAPAAIADLVNRWRDRPHKDGYESKIDAVIESLPPLPQHDAARASQLGVDEPWGPTMIVAPTLAELGAAYRAMGEGRMVERPPLFANIPSQLDPTMRVGGSDGAHVLSLEVLYTPYALRGGWDRSAEPERWLDLLGGLLGTEMLSLVRDWRVVTPPVYETEFRMRKGHAPSFAGGPVAALIGRDKVLTRYETPLVGLFLTGAATFPGAGVWGASGRNTAHVLLAAAERCPSRFASLRKRLPAA